MKNRLFYVAIFLLLALGVVFSACATTVENTEVAEPSAETTSSEPVTIRYWHTMSDTETAKFEEVIAAFEEANPGIKVEATRYAADDFKTALTTAIAGGDAPDTARLDIAWVPQFADEGALMQLDGVLPDFDTIASGVFPGPLSTNKWEGHYYGLPLNTNTQVLVYSKDAFAAAGIESAPTTIDEFVEDACLLTDAATETYGFAEGGTYFWAPAPLFYAMGGKVTDDEITTATGYINGPESVAAFTMLKDLYDRGCLSPNLLGGGIATDAGSGSGKYAMIIDGPWMVDIYKSNYPDFNYDFALIPAGESGTSSVVGGEDIVILDGSENKEAALKWVAYLMSPEAQKTMAQAGVIPTLSSLIGDPDLPAYFSVFMEQLETAQARVPSPSWSGMDTAIGNAYQRILNGDQTVQESLDQAAAEINALLAE
ncbi:MAG: extracellular solute-binding protein [Chloroflexi bacterium]|nr:extracellular solute-binding protein [Chloroflexota bacterium]